MRKLHHIQFLIIICMLIISPAIASQNFANNWLFGDFGLEFRSDTVLIRSDYATGSRGMGIISDKYGNLLCYTDGLNIWNKNHTIMPNGKDLLGDNSSLIQESIIIPKPGSESECYIFTVDSDNGQNTSGLYYSIVDLTEDNGLGDVTLKAKKIQNETSNKITAVYHNNGHDVWIITHQYNTNNYYAYLLSEKGLTEIPVVSSVGKSIEYSFDGQLKASPDGEKIACSYDISFTAEGEGFSLFDFDNSTGKLTNPISFDMPVSYRGCDGLEFSPDAKKLFVCQQGSLGGENAIYQFDISHGTYDEINNSRFLLFYPMDNDIRQMQLAPNGKIYFTKGGGQDSGSRYLGVIENPNDWGNECVVNEQGLYLEGKSAFVAQTPNFIQNYFFKTGFIFTNACSGSFSEFQITNELKLDSVRWEFGEGSSSVSRRPQFKYDEAGDYTVTLFAFYPEKTDTIRKEITINSSPVFDLGEDTTVCYGYELSIAENFESYQWNTGDNTRSIIITKSGNYQLTVENEYGCQASDSVYLNVNELPTIALPDSIQLEETLGSILVNPGNFESYFWSTGETTPTISIEKEGWYSVTVENEAGCTNTKSFYVYIYKQIPEDTYGWELQNPQPSPLACLDICFLNSQVGYVLNEKQVLGTSDGGKTWNVLTEILSGKNMEFKDNYGYILGNGIIYKSTYMGGGWNILDTQFFDYLVGISVVSKDTVFVAGYQEYYTSFDGGESWTTSNFLEDNAISSIYFINSIEGYIGCSNGNLYKTLDGGKTWDLKISVDYFPADIHKIYFVDRETGFISRGYSNILKTTDGGETWKAISSEGDKINSFFFLDSQTGFMAGEHGVIFRTTNGGKTWDWAGFQDGRYYGTDINTLYFVNNETGFAVGLGGRILKTIDGGRTWNQYAVTYDNIRQLQLISDTIGYGLVRNSFIKTTDGGNTWTNIGAPLSTGNTVRFDFINETIGYCIAGGEINTSASVANVYKTIDGGKTWTATNNGMELMRDDLYTIDFIDEETGYVSGGFNDRASFKTTDGGNTWTKMNDYRFSQMQFINSSVGYGWTTDYFNQIYKTTDGGETWTSVYEINNNIMSFYFLDENTGFIIKEGLVFCKTTDGGASWQEITLPYGSYTSMKFISQNIGFISDEYGITYQTSNGGISWELLNKPYNSSGIELFGEEIYAYGENGLIMKKKIEPQAVILVLNEASEITNQSAILSGNVTSNKEEIKNIKFEYGVDSLSDILDVQPNSVQPNQSLDVSVRLENLTPGQEYIYRLSATVNDISYTSEIYQFTTMPDYEMILTDIHALSNEVKLTGDITSNTNIDLTDIEFQYGTDNTSFNLKIAAQPDVVSSGMTKMVSAYLDSLEPETEYYVRIKANYNGTDVFSPSVMFSTSKAYIIETYIPQVLTDNSIGFEIFIQANKDAVRNVVVEYGTTREYENRISIPTQIDKGNYEYVSAQISGLDPSSVIFYRIKADMGTDVIYSNENIFKFEGGILIIPIEYKQLSHDVVLLQSLINPNGVYLIDMKFQYGLTENFDNWVGVDPLYSFYGTKLVSATLFVIPDTEYYARIAAIDRFGNYYYSDIFTFTIDGNYNSISEINRENGISLYPNPAKNIVRIKSEKSISQVSIVDSFGKLLLVTENDEIDISQWPKGIYFVRIAAEGEYVVKKLVKN